jgi:pimeloyl-ACP methyl ester carboxylesterase
MIVLQLAAAHPDCVAAIVTVDPTLVYSPDRRATVEAVAAGIEAGDHGSRSSSSRACSYALPTGSWWRMYWL